MPNIDDEKDYCVRGRIPLGGIVVDAYQRGVPTPAEVAALVKKWDRRAAGVVYLSLRNDDPRYFCVDGQRRVAAALELYGPDYTIEAQVWLGLTRDEEAYLFEQYQDRKPMKPLDHFRSQSVRNDPEALGLQAILDALDLRVALTSHNGDPNAIPAVGALMGCYSRFGPDILRRSLRLLRDGFGRYPSPTRNAFNQGAILGMCNFVARYQGVDFSETRLLGVLARLGPVYLHQRAQGVREIYPNTSPGGAWGRAVLAEYNRGLRTGRLPEWEERWYGTEAMRRAAEAKRRSPVDRGG
jgi:hypothetical protein